ncbi:MAG: lipid-A-disaccharide synthase [Fibrobacterota bacterium]
MRKIFISAGETSGDNHGAPLIRELRSRFPGCEIYGIGGKSMALAGQKQQFRTGELSFMGILEVLKHLPFIFRALRELRKFFKKLRPDLVILIDFPDFNFRLARYASGYRIPVLYYISPQIWAWRTGRVKTIKKYVSRMAVIFPFEKKFYEKHGVDVEFTGHPLADMPPVTMGLKDFRVKYGISPADRIVAFIPGSREQEVSRIMPVLAGAANKLDLSNVKYFIPRAPGIDSDFLLKYTSGKPEYIISDEDYYSLLSCADCGVVTSGTATLECGFFSLPSAVVYKTSAFTYLAARLFVKTEFIGMVNLIAEKEVAPEFIQGDATPDSVASAILRMLDQRQNAAIRKELVGIRQKLGGPGSASRVADMAEDLLL